MPYLSDRIDDNGPSVEILIGVSEPRRELLRRNGFPVPASILVRGQADTGSAVSGISPDVLARLDLRSVDTLSILTPSTGLTPHVCPAFHVSIGFSQAGIEHILLNAVAIESVFAPEEGIQALLGRDVLQHCLLVYDGKGRTFHLAF